MKTKKKSRSRLIKTSLKAFKSKLEERVFGELSKVRGIKVSYETERLPYRLDVTRNYIPDFPIIITKTGRKIYVETKGRFVQQDRAKHLLVKAQHPDKDIRLVFQRDNVLYKGSKTKYSTWCEKNGIIYSIGSVPEEWLM